MRFDVGLIAGVFVDYLPRQLQSTGVTDQHSVQNIISDFLH